MTNSVRRVLRVDANTTLEEVSPRSSMRAVTDGSMVALVYEAENVRGERSLVFESPFRTVRLDVIPEGWEHSSEFDLVALWQGGGARANRRSTQPRRALQR